MPRRLCRPRQPGRACHRTGHSRVLPTQDAVLGRLPTAGVAVLAVPSKRPMEPGGPNSEQIAYWNEKSGPKWVARQEMLDAMIRRLGERAMAALDPRPGETL